MTLFRFRQHKEPPKDVAKQEKIVKNQVDSKVATYESLRAIERTKHDAQVLVDLLEAEANGIMFNLSRAMGGKHGH
jgi:hypothetical protein